MNRLLYIYSVIALLTVFANTASADFVDFSSSDFSEANGKQTYTIDAGEVSEVGMTIIAAPEGADIYWDSQDGLGVDSLSWWDEADEIDNCEMLTIKFENSVDLASVYLTDLFYENGYLEMGYYILNNGTVEVFEADMSQVGGTNGELTLDIGAYSVASISFKALPSSFFKDNDYSVKGIDFTLRGNASVPELDAGSSVSALALLFGGVFVVNGRRKLTL